MSVKRGIAVYLFLKSVSVRVRLTLTLTLDPIPRLRSRFRPKPRPLPRPHVLLTPLNLVPGAVLTLWHCFTNKRRKSSSVRFYYILQKRKSRPERGRFFFIYASLLLQIHCACCTSLLIIIPKVKMGYYCRLWWKRLVQHLRASKLLKTAIAERRWRTVFLQASEPHIKWVNWMKYIASFFMKIFHGSI